MSQLIRIATRSSAQARIQAEIVGAALVGANPGCRTELVFVETLGDQQADVPLHTIGGQGVFVKEVQRAVLDGHADIAVHSAKDLPSLQTVGLAIGAFCARRDPRDALVGSTLHALTLGATVATGSVRRRAQLLALRPDLHLVELRGNIHTRLTKIPDGGAIVMAIAALEVLGLRHRVDETFDIDAMVPAVGQGCVAVEHRTNDAAIGGTLASIDDAATRRDVVAERTFLAELGTGCSLPIGAHVANGVLSAFLAAESGRCLQSSVELGRDWNATAQRTAQEMHAEILR